MDESPASVSTAFHEAAHAVVAFQLGAEVRVGVLSEDRAQGAVEITWRDPVGESRQRKTIQVAAAGPLGQLKQRARLRWPGCQFDRTDRLPFAIKIVRAGDIAELSGLALRFTAHGITQLLEVDDLNDLTDFEQMQKLSEAWSDAALFDAIDGSRDLLDQPENWQCVERTAALLVSRGSVHGQDISMILRSATA